jgi:hypothetical protein
MQGTHSRFVQWRGSGFIYQICFFNQSFVYICKGLFFKTRHCHKAAKRQAVKKPTFLQNFIL